MRLRHLSLGQPWSQRHSRLRQSIRPDPEMFRASPWISYDPASGDPRTEDLTTTAITHNQSESDMDEDVDMDAPHISTLREEDSPPPQSSPSHTGKFRVNLVVNEPKPGTKFITFNGETGEEARESDEADEEDDVEEEEEDQLIDDDEEGISSTVVTPGPSAPGPSTRGAAPPKRGKGRGSGTKRKGRTASHAVRTSPSRDVADPIDGEGSSQPTILALKKAVPKGTTAAQRAPRKSVPKSKHSLLVAPVHDELSEGYTGTAPSSPTHHGAHTPEVESITAPALPGVPQADEFNLDTIALPRYPLPSKPFYVQPPPKIGTGYAPVIPLDRTGKKVRHWRTANREIRGIAGGRWFARSWVGEKDSELASAAAAATAANQQAAAAAALETERLAGGSGSLTLPKLPTLSLSAPPAGRVGAKARAGKAETVASSATSRSASTVPDVTSVSVPPGSRAATRKKSQLSIAVSEIDKDIELVL